MNFAIRANYKQIIFYLGMALFVILASLSLAQLSQKVELRFVVIAGVLILLSSAFLLPIRWMMMLLFGYLGFEGFFKIVSYYNPIVHVGADLFMGFIILKLLATSVGSKNPLKKLPPLSGLFALHFLWFLIAFFNPYQLSLFASLAGMKMYVSMVLLYFLGYAFTNMVKDAKQYLIPWIVVIFFQVIFSLYQTYYGESSVLNLHPGYYMPLAKFKGYAFRPFGFTSLAGGPSVFLFLVNGFLVYFLFYGRKFSTQLLMLTLIMGSWVTLFLCQVRSAILKSILSTIIFFYFQMKYAKAKNRFSFRQALVPLMVIVTLSFSLNWMTSSNEEISKALDRSYTTFDYAALRSARESVAGRFISLIKDIPLGAGMSRTGAAAGKFADKIMQDPFFSKSFFTDNFWLAVQIDLGIPAVILLTSIVFLVLGKGYQHIKAYHHHEVRMLHVAIFSGLCASVAGFYGAESILYNPEAAFFWFFAGVLMKLPEIDREMS